jgi:hypothetical protein
VCGPEISLRREPLVGARPVKPWRESHVQTLNIIPVYIHHHSRYFNVVPRSCGAQPPIAKRSEWSGRTVISGAQLEASTTSEELLKNEYSVERYFFDVHFIIIHLPRRKSPKWSSPLGAFRLSFDNISHLSNERYMPSSFQSPWSQHPNNTVEMMAFPIVQFFSSTCYFLSIGSKYFPLRPVHKHYKQCSIKLCGSI